MQLKKYISIGTLPKDRQLVDLVVCEKKKLSILKEFRFIKCENCFQDEFFYSVYFNTGKIKVGGEPYKILYWYPAKLK
jgi:hypothetical protein